MKAKENTPRPNHLKSRSARDIDLKIDHDIQGASALPSETDSKEGMSESAVKRFQPTHSVLVDAGDFTCLPNVRMFSSVRDL